MIQNRTSDTVKKNRWKIKENFITVELDKCDQPWKTACLL